ncbi:CD276 antigen-like isoform X3 [Betta splendens]|nr:CD276 antigen-like isoform X3 [Betta splendens]XP_055370278.1 CD276 antigen-like isoform X3 [Betta splendens]
MKMIFRILLLISFISCVSGSLVVNVTQTHYQAEQNHSITLEWTFTPKPDTSITSVYIICQLVTDLRASVLFHHHEGVEVSESQDQQFSGRVHFDRDELREGRLRLQVSRLRTDDSGRYDCTIRTPDGWNMDVCRLNVTAAVDQHRAQMTVSPEPENVRRTGLYAALMLTAALLFVCVLLLPFFRFVLKK